MADVSAYLQTAPHNAKSPIDRFYAAIESIVTLQPAFFSTYSDDICALLYVGLITATENYFRDTYAAVLRICPSAQTKAAAEKVQLGSFLWGVPAVHGRAAFEFLAFSSKQNIVDAARRFVDYAVKPAGSWHRMLDEYDKLCELRHGIVHSGHLLSGKNALRLSVPASKDEVRISPSYATVQEAGAICSALVQAANNELFEEFVRRWAGPWRNLATWQSKHATRRFRQVYSLFLSSRDITQGSVANPVSFRTLLARAQREYGV